MQKLSSWWSLIRNVDNFIFSADFIYSMMPRTVTDRAFFMPILVLGACAFSYWYQGANNFVGIAAVSALSLSFEWFWMSDAVDIPTTKLLDTPRKNFIMQLSLAGALYSVELFYFGFSANQLIYQTQSLLARFLLSEIFRYVDLIQGQPTSALQIKQFQLIQKFLNFCMRAILSWQNREAIRTEFCQTLDKKLPSTCDESCVSMHALCYSPGLFSDTSEFTLSEHIPKFLNTYYAWIREYPVIEYSELAVNVVAVHLSNIMFMFKQHSTVFVKGRVETQEWRVQTKATPSQCFPSSFFGAINITTDLSSPALIFEQAQRKFNFEAQCTIAPYSHLCELITSTMDSENPAFLTP